ncbi:MAG TPA: PAS domain-containing protein [Candidatus Saccharimonadia bacterium]|nr:PAS domain-containing protein [Candidatus Saccharimonadia bacterium]
MAVKAVKVDADELWHVAWTYIKTVVDTVRHPFLILDENLVVISANKTFYTMFEVTQNQTEGKKVYDLGNGEWSAPKLRILLEDILPKNTFFEDFKVDHEFPKIGRKVMMLNARRVYTTDEERPIILLAMEDLTRQRQLEEQLKAYTKSLTREVAKRTAQLEFRVRELEKLNRTITRREKDMQLFKKELEELKASRLSNSDPA